MNRTRPIARAALLAAALALSLAGCKRKEYYPEAVPAPPPPGPAAPPGMPAPPPGMPPGGPAIAQVPSAGHIADLERAAALDPKSARAWIDLGNAYFDARQPQRSVDAYAKALAIEPKNPDVLTDQGVMYRELHQVDRAVENFEKASKLDPGHVQSVFNLGVVWAMDMKRSDKAIEAWNRVIQMAPGSPQAAQARELIARLRAQGGQ